VDILVNVQSLQPPVTGIGRYTAELLKCLKSEHSIQSFDSTTNYSQIQLEQKLDSLNELSTSSNTQKKVRAGLGRMASRLPYAYKVRQLIQKNIRRSLFETCSGHIYWEPNYILEPFDGMSVATIHDLSYIRYPQHHRSASLKWLESNIESSIKQASAIVTLSEFSKHEILKNFPVQESEINIVSPAVVDDFKQSASNAEIQYIRGKYKLPKNYILSVGTLEPRKNIKSLLKAYTSLPKVLKDNYPLVLVGAKGWGDVDNDVQHMLSRKEIIVLGYVAQNDIATLYKAADLFVYISLYEGYGMPVAEAMASKVAIITSENSAMSEVAQNTTGLVNPLDIEQVATMIKYYLQEKEARHEMVAKYQPIVASWSWQKSADKLTHLFQELT